MSFFKSTVVQGDLIADQCVSEIEKIPLKFVYFNSVSVATISTL